MRPFQHKSKCPNCNTILDKKPKHKQKCPYCGNLILLRGGDFLTENEARIGDWLIRLEHFGVTCKDFTLARNNLTEQFGKPARVNDTLWRILNELVIKYGNDYSSLEHIYREMSSLVSREGKDPTPYLMQANIAREKSIKQYTNKKQRKSERVFLSHDELAYVRRLRSEGKLGKAEELLKKAEPSPAVLDEIRKIASAKAKQAKREGDWQAVIRHLEGYNFYTEEN